MMKRSKRFLALALLVSAALFTLSGCGFGCGGGEENADLVFVNDSDAAIAAVAVDLEDRSGGIQHADSSPLKRGESFGFETGKYPATVAVYEDRECRKELGRLTVPKAPPVGERWYVTARDGGGESS